MKKRSIMPLRNGNVPATDARVHNKQHSRKYQMIRVFWRSHPFPHKKQATEERGLRNVAAATAAMIAAAVTTAAVHVAAAATAANHVAVAVTSAAAHAVATAAIAAHVVAIAAVRNPRMLPKSPK